MLNPFPSTATKATLLDMIYEECGRAGYEFDREPGEDAMALRRIDGMMAEWAARGINLHYNFPASFGMGLPSDALGIPDAAINTVAAWGALRLAPTMGKTLSPETKKAMQDGLSFLIAETAEIPSMPLPRTAGIGMGRKPTAVWWPFSRDEVPDYVTLIDVSLADASADHTKPYATRVVGYQQGAVLSLVVDAGGKYALSGDLLTGTGLSAGSDSITVRQTFPGATNSPLDTVLTITVT